MLPRGAPGLDGPQVGDVLPDRQGDGHPLGAVARSFRQQPAVGAADPLNRGAAQALAPSLPEGPAQLQRSIVKVFYAD